MKIETVEEFLKRGGKIDKITEFKHASDPSFFVSQRAKQEAFKKKQEGLKNGVVNNNRPNDVG